MADKLQEAWLPLCREGAKARSKEKKKFMKDKLGWLLPFADDKNRVAGGRMKLQEAVEAICEATYIKDPSVLPAILTTYAQSYHAEKVRGAGEELELLPCYSVKIREDSKARTDMVSLNAARLIIKALTQQGGRDE